MSGQSRIVGLDHVQLAMPIGGEEAARGFYGAVLGFVEVPKPAALGDRGGCWFVTADPGPAVALHLGTDRDFRPARRAHVALLIDDLEAFRRTLDADGIETADEGGDIGVRRFYAFDPFGNRLEFVDERDRGFTVPRPRA